MALADYYLCDICECKTFYDSDLAYEFDTPDGKPKLPRVGAMKVICEDCAKDYDVEIVAKAQA